MPAPTLWRLRRDSRGTAAVQFALLTPALVVTLLGSLETATVLFVSGTLEGAVLAASRYGVTGHVEGDATREDRIREIIGDRTLGFVDMNTVEITTRVYENFTQIGQCAPAGDEDEGSGNGHNNDDEDGDGDDDGNNGHGNGDGDDGDDEGEGDDEDGGASAGCENEAGTPGIGAAGDIVLYEVEYETRGMTSLMRPLFGAIVHKAAVAVRNEPFEDETP